MSLRNEVDAVFRREVKSLPAYDKAQAATGSGIAHGPSHCRAAVVSPARRPHRADRERESQLGRCYLDRRLRYR
jgi:hypothetical protein